MRHLAQASDVQLHIGESIRTIVVMDSGLIASRCPGMTGRMELHQKIKFVSPINAICPVKPSMQKYSAFPK
jgi:hypothetical protein